VFRTIEKHLPTLLIDEADTFLGENEELRGLINSGHTRETAFVVRTVGDDHEPKRFSTWGFKAIAGIGKRAATIEDRAITISLKRKLPGEKVERLRHADPGLFETLARKLVRFAADNMERIAEARPELPDALNDRAQDNWEPLLAIADAAGGPWQQKAREAALALSGTKDEPASLGVELLRDIRTIFAEEAVDRLAGADLVAALIAKEERPWGEANRGKPITQAWLARR
jgi:putative DNA primase/helicase